MWANLIQSLTSVLEALYSLSGSYGIAIMMLTLVFHILIMPLTVSQNRSIRKMQELQPEIAKLQKKYKEDKPRQNEEMMKLWKEHNVNPMGGCLPMLIQLPIMIAIFFTIREFQFTGPASFLWISNLAEPDPFYILPVLAGITTFLHTKVSQPAAGVAGGQQTMMLYGMPIFIGWITIQFPAALAVYWVTSNIFRVVQHFVIDARSGSRAQGEKAS